MTLRQKWRDPSNWASLTVQRKTLKKVRTNSKGLYN